jgi:putative ABC transport system permease protein
VPAGILAVVAVTAWVASLRAARLRTVDALTVGRGAETAGGRYAALARAAGRVAARLPVSRPVGLGAVRPFARPVRAAAILLAIAAGTASVTFALGLGSSLIRIQTAIEQNTADVVVEVPPDEVSAGRGADAGGGTRPPDPAAVLATISAQDGTRAAYGLAQTPVAVAGLTDPVGVTAFTGDATWDGFEMVSGRWFTGPGEAVAGEAFLRATGARVGDTVTVQAEGTPVRLRIVGQVFDSGTTVLTGADTVAAALPHLRPHEYRIALTDGTDPAGYAQRLSTALDPLGLSASPNQTEVDTQLHVVQGLTATLTLLLVAVAALGVFNMLVLDLRDRVHDLGVHKALGMTPRQTIAMVVASVTGVGLLGGLIGVPVGVAVQHLVVPAMAAGGGLRLPDSFVDVYGPTTLVPLALGGLVIALLGALLPAGWAARTRTAVALRTE